MSQLISYLGGNSPGGPGVNTITGTSGGAVGPDGANNINLLGEASLLQVVGNPATHTLNVQFINTGTDGQLLIGSSAGAPAWASLTSTGGTVTFTAGHNTLNLEVADAINTWNFITAASANLVANNNYVANRGTLVTFTLPAAAAAGTYIRIQGMGAGGWTVIENAGQFINFGSSTTTTTTGSLSSTNQYDSIDLLCLTANTQWAVRASIGNITVV